MMIYLFLQGSRENPEQRVECFLFRHSAFKRAERAIEDGASWEEKQDHETAAIKFWVTSARWMSIVPVSLKFTDFSLRRWVRDRCHWQNLNEDREGKVKGSILKHGRAWFHPKWTEGKRDKEIRVEWSFWTHFWAVQFDVGAGDGNDGLSFWIAFGLLSFHFTVEGVLPRRFIEWGRQRALQSKYLGYEYMAWPRSTGIRVFESTVWFEIWNWDFGWDSRQPKWMSFNFCPVDFLLGCRQYSSQEIGTYDREISMPEGSYPVTVKLTEDSWKRPRWPWPTKVRRAHIECSVGIPTPGKGENDYDCGEDASYGLTCPASSVDEALGKLKVNVMRDRVRYGGKGWLPAKVKV